METRFWHDTLIESDGFRQMQRATGYKPACLVLVLWATALIGLTLNAEETFSFAAGKTTATLPFEVIDNRVFVEVRLNGVGPFHLILDTGAGGFSIAGHVAQRLGLQVEDAGEGTGVGEKTVRSGRAQILQAELGPLRFENIEASVFPGDDSKNVFGKQAMDGVVGLEVFERVIVKHDYVHKVLTFTLPEAFQYRGSGTVVHFERTRFIPVVDAELDGVRGKFGIDTGARSSLLAYTPFVDQNHLQEKYHARLEGVTGWGFGGPVRSLLARARELRIDGIAVHDLVIRLSTQRAGLTTSSAMAGLIGPDVLSQFDVTFDYPHNRLIFEKNKNYGRRDSYDRSGMWMGQEGEHFTVVDVIAGGPAAEAGIQTGETILAINGVSTAKLVLPDVREQVRREAPGRKVTFLLQSNGKQRTVVVTLRDLV